MVKNYQSNDEIQALLANFTNELTTLVRRSTLQQLQSVLGGSTMTSTAAPTMTRKVKIVRMGKSSSGGKRTTEQVAQFGATLLDFVMKNPGQRGEQIAQALKTDVKTMRLPMLRLIGEKKIKTKGQRRGMTYFAA
ncbi:MAG: hypothetical protein HZA53_02455 [Planctomycetes bacterium]|nr:hypothetical protein [Planctomycetota bacterium]